jgi:hypothetical protein
MELSPPVLAVLILAALSGVAVLFRLLRDPAAMLYLIPVMLFFCGLAAQRDRNGNTMNRTWALPLQQARAELYMAVGAILFLGMLIHVGRLRLTSMPVQGFILLLIQCYAALLRFYHPNEGPVDGAKSFLFAVLTVTPLLTLTPTIVNTWDDHLRVIRAVIMGALLWGGGVAIQIAINPRQVVTGADNRFTGLLGNPQGTCLFMAPLAVGALWLVLNDPKKVYKPLWIALFAMLAMFLAWTGSRLALVTVGLGLVAVLYARAGRAILFLPIVFVVGYAAFQIADSTGLASNAFERLGSGKNTRAVGLQALIEDAIDAPFLGVGFSETRFNENSYLVGHIAYGYVMTLLTLTLLVLGAVQSWRLWRARATVGPDQKRLIDFLLGFQAMFYAASMFEWFLIARLEAMPFYMCLFGTLTTRAIEMARAESELAAASDGPNEHEHSGFESVHDERIAEGYGENPSPARDGAA